MQRETSPVAASTQWSRTSSHERVHAATSLALGGGGAVGPDARRSCSAASVSTLGAFGSSLAGLASSSSARTDPAAASQ